MYDKQETVRTRNFRQGGEGLSGSTCCIVADRKKSMIADVVFEELIEDCILCTFGNSSEIISRTVSKGSLSRDDGVR